VQGATVVTLGKAAAGQTYTATVYVVGVINGQWGVYHSDDGGATWARFNDNAHQFGGIFGMAGDWNTYGRTYAIGNCRGLVYTN
jgi:xyloglucan-specific exo-beta-1,4-glucanase